MPDETPPQPDWAASIVDNLDSVVNAIRAKTSEPLLKIVKYILLGVMVTGLAIMTLLLFTIGGIRLLNNYLPGGVWLADLLLGLIFLLGGFVLWGKRRVKTK